MGEWALARLGDLIRIEHGWAFPGSGFGPATGKFPRIVNIGDFALPYASQLKTNTMREFVGEYPSRFELSPGDILIAMTCQTRGGEVLGIPMAVPNDGRTYLHNQRLGKVVIMRPDLIVGQYLFYLFLSRRFNGYLTSTASGSAIIHTAPNRIESYQFPLPPLSEQRAIAEVLGALDDKIEANRRVMQTAWSLAEVHFRRVTEADNVDFVPLSQLADLSYGKSLPEHARQPGSVPVFGSGGIVGYHSYALVTGPGVIVGRKGTAGAVHWCQSDFFPIDTTFYVQSDHLPMPFLYFVLRSLGLDQMNFDSAVPGLNRSAALARLVPTPSSEDIDSFTRVASFLTTMVAAREWESALLAAMRDALLPKLLSGELRVRDAEELVGEVV